MVEVSDEVVIELSKVLVDVVIASVDKVVTKLGRVVATVAPVKTELSEIVCVNLSCSSMVLKVIPISSTMGVVDIGISLVISELCIVLIVVLGVVVSSGTNVLASVVDCSVIALVVSGTEVVSVSLVSSSGIDRSNP